jgi:hypothetical protein
MGIDLGEKLTFSAVAMNPAKNEELKSHSRSAAYLMEPLKRYRRWLNR